MSVSVDNKRGSLSLAAALLILNVLLTFSFSIVSGRLVSGGTGEAFGLAGNFVLHSFELLLCVLLWRKLVRAVNEGYPPWRCSLAAVLLLATTAWPACILGWQLLAMSK